MDKNNLEKLAFENPNDFELGGKIREMIQETEEEQKEEIVRKQETNEPDWKNLYMRASADFENYKKRMAKDREEVILRTRTSMLESIMDIDSDIALAALQIEDEGIKLIISKLDKFLANQGIKTVPTEKYDANLHEVISMVPGQEPNSIVSVVSKGYSLGDKIIRYPKVIIGK